MLEQQIRAGTFDINTSPVIRIEHFRTVELLGRRKASGVRMLFSVFVLQWLEEKRVEWRQNQIETVDGILRVT